MVDGSEYEGKFENDTYSGFGQLRMVDGTVFEGIFIDSKCPNFGRVKMEEGNFEGEVMDFKPTGLG